MPAPARSILLLPALLAAGAAVPLPAQHPEAARFPAQTGDPKQPMFTAPAGADRADGLRAMQLAPGLTASMVAAEPDLCNVVAFAIDGRGRIFVSETFRIHDGVFDTREHMQWRDEDLACRTVADRLEKYEKHLAKDIPGYAAYSERVKLLLDDDGDHVVDRSAVFADGFADLADGIASGVLPVGGDVWFTNIPKLWRLRDADGDGAAEAREAVFDGFGVHTSLIGHDLHGLVLGPDRRLYFSIGDRGFDVTTREGTHLAYPHEGAVLRCELDGSRLEVVHRGLRNPQELAFDDRGNLFTGDNNSDGGDQARLVQIVDGADSGWRIGFQWLADRGAWNREHMWLPRHDDRPLRTLPPIQNVGDGPSGLVFDPGQGLPARYRGCFFLCDFRGGAGYSGVHALRLGEHGAGFEIEFRDRPAWSVLATDVDFGPDGALYVSDWVSGWNKTGKGRLYRIERSGHRDDPALRATAELLARGVGDVTDIRLAALLRHADRRVRQLAQFELVDRDARVLLAQAAVDPDSRDARLAGVWGLGILGRSRPDALDPLRSLLQHGCADTRAQAARMFGDARRSDVAPELAALLRDPSPRVRREAALALGRMDELPAAAATTATAALLEALRDNGDRDPVLRHAAVFGLAACAPASALLAARDDADPAVRVGALLALARRGDIQAAVFLGDADPIVRREAARCCYDGDLDGALPMLAAVLPHRTADDPAIGWRALNAARLLGTPAHAAAVAAFAAQQDRPASLRREALEILAEWRAPSGQDRVLGNWRPSHRTAGDATMQTDLVPLLDDDAVADAAADACAALQLRDAAPALAALVRDRARPEPARTAALRALDALGADELDAAVAAITADDPTPLRTAAVQLFAERAPQKAAPVLATLCERAELQERQAAFASLGTLPDPAAAPILLRWLDAFARGEVDAAIQLDLLDAAAQRREPAVRERLQAVTGGADDGDPLAPFRVCLEGGDARRGREVVLGHAGAACTRCHSIAGKGGNAGPLLDGVAGRGTREYLLESLVQPSARIAAGFAMTVLTLQDGGVVAGTVTREQDGVVEVTGLDGTPRQVPLTQIASRATTTESAMPPMAGLLDRRQLRDVVEFLASLTAPK
ncbi:MAG: PVC-type heme-binding CxxCH protein [Planctomycetota bacterium]